MSEKDKPMLTPLNRSEPAANLAEMANRAGVRIVTAAWPTGLAQLGVMVTACERCDAAEVCRDWSARAPEAIGRVPPFCPNADALNAARKTRS